MAFDPDQYLAQKAPPQAQGASGGFDPDSYLAAKTEPSTSLVDAYKSKGLGGAWDQANANLTAGHQAAQAVHPNENMSPPWVQASKAGQFGSAAEGLTNMLKGPGLAAGAGRVAANTGIGALSNPDHPGMGAAAGLAGGLASEALPLIPAVAKSFGRVAAKMSHTGVEGYVANPEMGEAAYNQFKTDPQGFQQTMADKVKQGQQAIYENNIRPQKQAIKMGLMGQDRKSVV